MKAIRLRTEYLNKPMGIDIKNPRFMWNAEGGVKQTAYQIITEEWDSGKVESSTMNVAYPKALASRQQVNWKIRLWDENDNPGDWIESSFEMGLLDASDWKAKWITGNYEVDKKKRYPVDYFRKIFEIKEQVKKARLYITACGLYDAKLNGNKIGDFFMAPGYTDYNKRVQYQTYDVTDLLATGAQSLTVELADGWYRGSCGAFGLQNQYGTETKFLAQLEIEYDNGNTDIVITDSTWDWSNDGFVRFADNKDGEIVDATLEPSFSGKAKVTVHSIIPSASNNVPVRPHEHFHPTITKTEDGKQLLDFGQNIAGVISFKINAHKGQRLFFRMGEMLDSEGNFTQDNIQLTRKGRTNPLQQVEYICKEGLNEYQTRFSISGFQYALLESDVEIKSEEIESIAMYSDLEPTGYFNCSHELINKLVEATIWSAKGNHLDIPTDCPTRERHGWTGDAQIFFETASIFFDFAAFSKKFLHDVYDWQKEDGCLPMIAPAGGADSYMNSMNGSVGWADIGIIIPYKFWKLFGDREILEEYYDGMVKYARFMERRCGKTAFLIHEKIKLTGDNKKYLVNKGQSYGEWAEPEDVCMFKWQDFVAPHPEVSTAYTAYILGLMSEISSEMGHDRDAAEFKKYSEGCKKAYQELVTTPNYSLDTDRQAQLVRPLAFDLLTARQTEFAKKRLIQALENYKWRLGTGFLSTPLILDVLASFNIDAAYRLLENEEIPGWLSMPKNGATTIWENWAGPFNTQGAGLGSLNHYSKGAVCEWLFKTCCGINVTGENTFMIKPVPGGSLTYAEASYNSVYGEVKSSWTKKGDGTFEYHISIPSNCTAKIILPNGTEEEVSAGRFSYC